MKAYYCTDYLVKDTFDALDNKQKVAFVLKEFSYDTTSYYSDSGSLSEHLKRFVAGFCLSARLNSGWTHERSLDFLHEVKKEVSTIFNDSSVANCA